MTHRKIDPQLVKSTEGLELIQASDTTQHYSALLEVLTRMPAG